MYVPAGGEVPYCPWKGDLFNKCLLDIEMVVGNYICRPKTLLRLT